ncbi:MAG: glycosyltransferase family 2 protein [Bacteroidota bacterium]
MIKGKFITVVLPSYNAASTLEKTFMGIPRDLVDHVMLVDDGSRDNTVEVAHQLGIDTIISHALNKGYGHNQKTCYEKALAMNSDIIIMLHPDYQYTPDLIAPMCYLIANGVYDVVFGSRILGKGALRGGMPLYKYISNRLLTFIQNFLMNQKLSEYHTGYRAYSRKVLESISFKNNSNDFVFDNEMVAQIFMKGFEIAEITCPTYYAKDSSSISFTRSIKYGMGVIGVTFKYLLCRSGIYRSPIFR